MTQRERYVKTLAFGQPDRIFYWFATPRQSTINAWYRQGLPRMSDITDYGCPEEFYALVGMDRRLTLPIKTDTWPPFKVRVLEENAQGRIWVDEQGITMHDSGADLTTPGFRTRSYLSHPVRNREDWVRTRDGHFEPHTPGRYPDDWPAWVERLKGRTLPLQVKIPGLYWKARDWVGFEHLSLLFYDDPRLVHDMMEHLTEFAMSLLERALREVEVDEAWISEDMCFKNHAMISPQMFREFMLPRYKRWVTFLRDLGVPLVVVDSDGYVGELLPLWIEAGGNVAFPLEIAAGNDPVAVRKQYGQEIAFIGGIDKREIRSKERTYHEVMRRVPWLIEQGGYLPRLDHAVPPDVPLRSYLYMCELIKALAEGRAVPGPDQPLGIEEQLGPIERMWSPQMAPQEPHH